MSTEQTEQTEQEEQRSNNDANFTIIPGGRIKSKNYVHEGKIYVSEKVKEDVLYLRCKRYKHDFRCAGRGKLQNNIFTVTVEHTCRVSSTACQNQILKNKLKLASSTTHEELRTLFNTQMSSPEATQGPAHSLNFVSCYSSMKFNRYKRYPKHTSTPQEVITLLESNSHPEVTKYYVGSCTYLLSGEKFPEKLSCKNKWLFECRMKY